MEYDLCISCNINGNYESKFMIVIFKLFIFFLPNYKINFNKKVAIKAITYFNQNL